MVPFSGWLMPVSYSGIQQEHFAVRQKAGVFDASHMGLVKITGPDALALIQLIAVNDASILQPGQSQYSAMCYENGTCVDDIYVSCIGPQEYYLAINAGCKEKDVAWIQSHRKGNVQAELLETGIVSVQGPLAVQVIVAMFGADLAPLAKNAAKLVSYAGHQMLITRTGYTGEDGFEIFPPNSVLGQVWDDVLAKGAPLGLLPCGLGCRDTLRLESGFSLYGHEINDTTNLVEAGLSWIIGWNKPAFIGKAALEKVKAEGPVRKLVGLKAIDKALPRDGMTLHHDGRLVGKVTSGGISPILNQGVALAYVESALAASGTVLEVQIRDQLKKFEVTKRRFVGGK